MERCGLFLNVWGPGGRCLVVRDVGVDSGNLVSECLVLLFVIFR